MAKALINFNWHMFWATLLAFMASALGLIVIVVALAISNPLTSPGDTYRAVPTSVATPGAASGAVCGSHGAPTQVWLSNDAAGGNIYSAICGDGTRVEFAK